ncbi:O-antigen ligase domain-containing protein [Candidatus Parcubacteria bacterium]|jgi:hypothetical protein|nr:MAG: O-antigen ligase domain-containing protein [Candidatus Parcubacteria bacterium]
MTKENNFLRWFAIIVFFLLPFNIKKYIGPLVPHAQNYSLEFSSIFLFVIELLVIAFIFIVFFYKKKELSLICRENWPFLVFSLLSFISVSVADNILLGVVFSFHILIAVLFMCCIGVLVRNHIISVRDIMKAFAVSALVQVEIALLQFLNQGSIGLRFLGEEVFNEFTRNIAKFNVFEALFLRPYGTLSHPNILGAVFVVGFIAWIYLFVAPSKRHGVAHRSVALIGLFFLALGLIVSFSRSAWFVSLFLYIICILFLFFKKQFKHTARELLIAGLVVGTTVFGIFGWAIVSRGTVEKTDSAIQERVIYSHIARSLINQYPFGVGVGNGIMSAEREGLYNTYKLTNLATHQPVHNIYLLVAEELGILGFIVFCFSIIKIIVERRKNLFLLDYFFPLLLITIFILTGFFDHYAITNNVGRLMFFGVLGIMIGLPREYIKKHDIY